MSLTAVGWLLVVSSIAISALFVFRPRSDAARLALLSRLRSSRWGLAQDRRGTAGTWIVAAAAFLLVTGVGAATSYLRDPPEAASSLSRSGLNGDMLARLEDYARSNAAEEPVSMPAASKPLPDVNTMIERLETRLQTSPGDIKGWRMLGWSYFNTGQYEQAAAAYARAVKLDPGSAEIKSSYEEAKAKASGTAPPLQTGAAGNGGDNLHVSKTTGPEALPPTEQDAAIRAMVDGLAGRLEQSPRDVEGWTRLMRSRVVLGETAVATTALRKALEVFKDDQAAVGRIKAAAVELGLKAE